MSDLIRIEHAGAEYLFDPHSTAEPEVEGLRDYRDHNGLRLVYEYELRGAHIGPPIKIMMINPQEDREDHVPWACWDSLVYADDEQRIDDVVDDFYSDALRKDLEIIIRETWY